MLKLLHDKLKLGYKYGPMTDGWEFIVLECKCGFEPHGRASETWEEYWVLKLPHIRAHTKWLDGWKPITVEVPMGFKGRTAENVVQQALQFLEECPNPLEMTQDQYNAMRN